MTSPDPRPPSEPVEQLARGDLQVAQLVTQHERDAFMLPDGFQPWTEPRWADETPHPLCHVTRDQYPEPRTCAFAATVDQEDGYTGPCHLGHPANCRKYVNTQLWDERGPDRNPA